RGPRGGQRLRGARAGAGQRGARMLDRARRATRRGPRQWWRPMIGTRQRRGGWLPGLREPDISGETTLNFPDIQIQTHRLTPAGLAAQMERIAAARDDYLAGLPVRRIVQVLDRVASRWLDPASPYRREAEALLPAITGYAEPAIRKGVSGYLSMLREENLLRLLDEELRDP